MKTSAIVAVALLSVGAYAVATATTKVTSITPNNGGKGGKVLVTLKGEGFSSDTFSYGEGNENKGNAVSFVADNKEFICDIHPNGCTQKQLQCYTRAGMPKNTVCKPRVTVDGVDVTDICTNSKCTFTPRPWLTPILDSIKPRSGKPGEVILTVHGRIFSTRFGSNLQASGNGVEEKILRFNAGSQKCDPFKAKDVFYHNQLDSNSSNYGTYQCKVKGTSVGSILPSILLESPYGLSEVDGNLKHISRTGEVYALQFYTDIQNVINAVGSTEGGWILTAEGSVYDENKTYSQAEVYVGDMKCDIVELVRNKSVSCRVPAKPAEAPDFYAGGYGVLVESFDSPPFSTLDGAITTTAVPSNVTWYPETRYCALATNTWTRMKFVFDASDDGEWDFYIKAKENAKLDIGDGASGESPGGWKWAYAGRKTLKAGQKVKMVAVGKHSTSNDACVHVKADHRDTNISSLKIEKSYPEIQAVKITSNETDEKFTLKFTSFSSQTKVNSQQKIVYPDSISSVRLKLLGAATPTVDLNDKNAVKKALNLLPFLRDDETFSVEKVNSNCIQVTLESKGGDIPKIETVPSEGITVEIVKNGISSGLDFVFAFGDMRGPLVTYDTSNKTAFADTIKVALETMSGVRCPAIFTSEVSAYHEGFESGPSTFVKELVTAQVAAFCGRYSCLNCKTLWPMPGRVQDPLLFRIYKWFCIAARGLDHDNILFKFKDNNENLRHAWITMSVIRKDGDWAYRCIDLEAAFKIRWPNDIVLSFKLYEAYVHNQDGTVDFYVDELKVAQTSPIANIQTDTDFKNLRIPIAYPNKDYPTTMDRVEVEYADDMYKVTLVPFDCGYDYKLLTIAGSTITGTDSADSDTVTSTLGGGKMVTTRITSGQKPLKGKLKFTYNGMESNDIEVFNSTAGKLEKELELFQDIGSLTVTQTKESTCANQQYNVQFDSSPGNRPELQITSQLTWPEAGAKAEIITLRDGFLSYDPIGGDIALSCFSEPQVRVYINGIPTKCELTGHNCTVTWSTDATPTVTQLSITEGNEGDTLEISGTLFSTTSTNNIVTIGGVPCEVTFSSETKIKCTVGRGQLNTYPVKVTVAGKGIASGNKNFTYTTDMTDITPEWSTLGGYVNLTVIGKGFSDDTVVMIGTEECIKTDIRIPVEINCQVPPYTDLSVTSNQTVIVSATTKGVQTTSTFTFTYAYTSAEISDILISAGEGQRRKRSTAAKLTVQGGQIVTITGNGMGNTGDVFIGKTKLEIIFRNDTVIKAKTPRGLQSGKNLPVLVFIGTSGVILKSNSIPTVDVILTVSKIYPTAGSKFGGTPLTIIGEGFGSIKADAVVSVGDYKCIVDSVTDNQIKCDIESTVKTHYVFNNGTTGEQYPYSFDKLVVKVQQGDAVQWQWTTPSWLVDVKHGIAETETLDSVEDKKGGISSGEKTQQGQFIQTFTELRDHYFWTYVDYNRKFYRMTVKVEPRSAETKSVSVFVAGQEAFYNVSSGQDDPTSTSGCSLAIADIVGCDTETASVPDSSKFSFRFSCLKTPIVNAITFQKADNVLENSALMTTPITFSGKGFASSDCANQAKIGDCACNVDTSTSTSFVCTPIASCEYDTRVYQALSLRVNQYGYALVNIEKTIDRSVAFLPLITGFTPKSGSAKGGTTVTISGKAFTNDATKVQVSFDGTDADCSDVEKSKLVCTTPYKSSTGSAPIAVRIDGVSAVCDSNIQCNFNYNASITPTVSSVTPTAVSAKTSLTFTGEELGTDSSKLSVTVGGENCYGINIVTDETSVSCYVDAIPAGKNAVKLTVSGVGDASTDVEVTGDASASVSPSTGSIYGHTELTLTGHGFVEGLSIQVNGVDICEKTDVQSLTTATCVTKAHGGAGAVTIIVTSNGVAYDAVDFEFSAASSPTIDSINPTSGAVDTTVTISGNHFGTNGADIKVYIGDAECIDVSLSEGDITCTTGAQSSGTYDTVVQVTGKGRSNTTTFTYEVTVTSFNPLTGDSGGNQLLTLNGNGFTASMKVTVCDNVCSFHKLLSSSQYLCVTPKGTAGQCKVKVTEGSASPVEAPTDYIYVNNASPSVTGIDPSGGGTGGNTDMTITGERFSDTKSEVSVEVDGVACEVTSSTLTQIVCSTGAHNGTKLSEVVVLVNNLRATAATDNILRFLYADVWNSTFTWGGGPVPAEGEMVVIPEGQSILLDTDTNILEMLLIQGDLIFSDKADVTLKARRILITNGGKLQVGTEDKPHTQKATIELHGHPREMELPVYGSKVLGVRNGSLELHGREIKNTWTTLAETAQKGATSIKVMGSIDDWQVNDEIVIATTGGHNSFNQNEKRKIMQISGGQITLDKALDFKHLGSEEEYSHVDGSSVKLQYRAEVGLLTRNVVVKGSSEDAWETKIEKCPEGFNAGEFATQTCFQGRFGEEEGSDQFGGHVIIHQPSDDSIAGQVAQAHISFAEFTHMGQAFRLGRYPIHFHLNGNMNKSYVKGSSIHKTFNRAINIHGVHDMTIECNVVYNVMGGALFLEDGIETGNIFDKNLAIFVKSSTSLLNDDITPAAYWATNPDNTYRNNHAAGGTHFGFWYRMHENPDGPSYTKEICPRRVPIREFKNNTAHSNGWFGLWIFQEYYPAQDGLCNAANGPAAAEINSFTTWNNEKGLEHVTVGAIHTINLHSYGNAKAGYEMKQSKNAQSRSNFIAMLNDSVIIGKANSPDNQNEEGQTDGGIVFPFTDAFLVHNIKFINFDSADSVPFKGTSIDGTCSDHCGVAIFQTSELGFENCLKRFMYRWQHEALIEDLDGTLCGTTTNKWKVLPKWGSAWPDSCEESCADHVVSGGSNVPALVCPFTENFFSFGFNNVKPASLEGKSIRLNNTHGDTTAEFRDHRMEFKNGWVAMLVDGEITTLTFINGEAMTNISFTGKVGNMQAGGCAIIRLAVMPMPDTVSLDGGLNSKPASDEDFSCETEGILTGNWSYQDGYVNVAIVNSENTYKDIKLDLKILKCYFPNCIKPPPKDEEPPFTERPDYSKKWDSKIWKFNTTGNLMTASESSETVNQFPAENQNVLIEEGMWVLISKYKVPALGIVTIKGGLEIDYEYTYDYEFKASVIIVLGGRFHVGWLNNPMTLPTARIILTGNRNSPMYTEIDGIPVSNKALAVYGAFEAHGLNHGTSWVRLAETAPTDTKTLTIRTDDSLNWKTGDSLIITSTSNNKEEAERVEIQSFDKDTGTITLKKKLKYRHSGGIETVNGRNIDLGAAVGILSRSISIEGEVVDGDADAWGGRIITSVTSIDGELRTGYARLHDVSLKHMGQDGFTEQSDPRFAIAYTDTGSVSAIKPSEVYRCAFADLYNSAFGAFGMDDIVFEDNVVLNALGNGVVTISENTTITHNLIANTQWTGSYDGRNEEFTLRFESALSAMGSKDLSIHDNYIAGSERIGYNVPGVDCENNAIMYSNNFGVGNVIAVGILPKDVVPFQCTRLSGFILFKNYDYGMYYHNTASLIAKDNVISDENFGLFPMVLGPDPLSHVIGNQFVKVEDSIVIGQSSVTNCTEETNPAGAYLDLSKDHRSSRGPGGERPYITIAVFTGGANNCPIKPCGQIMSYNAISGEMKIKNVTFVNFDVAKSGCKAAFAISTLKDNDDANHPVFISEAKHINVKDLFKILIHRPNVGKINPADCVDMDCDGLKKVLVKDMDGTFMGVKGSFIPQSEFEWDGDDTRRGLGDYRIPKDALTTVIGEVVSVDSLAPKGRGIVRPDACKLEKVSNGKAAYWWCPGEVDYEMMLIESYDSDRETRRLSPIAFFSGGYVDLMNGPQDHGWCNGYTCQKRISTFLAMILSGKNVSIYFSSTQPDLIRFALIRAGDDKCAVVALYYLNPNRIDVYIEDGTKHVLPTNGEIDANNNFRLKNEEGVSYIPTCSNDHGSNYIDREARLIYFVIKGGTRTIFLKRANVIVVAFGFPSVSEEDFFDSDRMIQNIAALLNIAVNKIRIVKIISESSGRRRRAAEGMTVLFEIGDGPTENIDDDIGDVTEEASQLMNECQEGNIGSALGEETNCEEIIVGQTTYIPAQPEELQFHDQISPQHEGVQFLVQPRIRAYDTNGDVIDNLGIEESPWEITASLRSCDPVCGHANAVLSGTLTIPSSNGWFNFTDLQISHKGDGYIIDFEISSPTGTNLTLASSPFSVDGLPMTAGVYSMTSGDIPQDSTFSITFDLRDNSTDIAIPDITWRGHTSFDVTCDLVTSSETGTFSGTLSKTFDSATGRATFDDLTFSGYGLVTISCLVVSTPDEYEFYSFRKVFVLGSHQASIVPEASAYIVVRYNADYDLTLPTPVAAAQLEQATIEVFTIKYTGVIIRNSFLSKGSILVTFTVEGQSLNVTSTKQEICKEISSGMQITIGGTALTLDKYMTVDGTDYYATCGEREKEDDGLHPAYIALIVLLCLLVIGIVVFVVVWRLKIRPKSKTHDLKGDETNNTNRGGFYYIDNGRTVFLGAQNQKARELSNNPKGNSNFQPQVAAPITTLYDEKPGRFHFRSSPLPPKQEDGTRGITPTGM